MKQVERACHAALVALLCGACGSETIDASATSESATDRLAQPLRALQAPSKGAPPPVGPQAPQSAWSWAGVGGQLPAANVKGVTGRVTVYGPKVKKTLNDDTMVHSLAEISAEDSTLQNTVEIGWNVYDDDPTPRLFVFYWVREIGDAGAYERKPKCNLPGVPHYRCDAFMSTSDTIRQDMPLTVGSTPTLGIKHVDSGLDHGWHFFYNGADFGYLPDSAWGANTFTVIHTGKWFGEVAGTLTARCSEMGNGRWASDSLADVFSLMQYTVQGQNPTDAVFNLFSIIQSEPSRYTVAYAGIGYKAPVRFGGPYLNSPNCPAPPPPPCKKKSCCGGSVLVCDTQSCPVVCPPPNQ